MNNINYFIVANVALVAFFLLYRFVLRNEVTFKFNRAYLVGSALTAFIIPFINFDWPASASAGINKNLEAITALQLKEIIITTNNAEIPWLMTIYFTGVAIMLTHFLTRLTSVYRIISRGKKEVKGDYIIVRTNRDMPAATFMKYIICSKNEPESVIQHELVHVRQHYSGDLLFAEILSIVCWFNPVCYLYKKAIKEVHEFIADSEASKFSGSKQAYIQLILSEAMHTSPETFINQFFNYSLLKRRIKILTMKTQKKRIYRYLLIFPVIVVLSGLNEFVRGQDKPSGPAAVTKPQKPDVQEPPAPRAPMPPANAPSPPTPPEPGPVGEKVDEGIDKMPEFPEGEAAMHQFIVDNIVYPEAAIEHKIEGLVVLQVIIDEEGKASVAKVLKDLEYGCTEASKNIVKKMPVWAPGEQEGKPVKVKVALPIRFKLPD